MEKILLYEPFYRGSHAEFAKAYAKQSKYEVSLMSVTGSSWKWNSRFSGMEFLSDPEANDILRKTDILLCSGYTRLEVVKPLLRRSSKVVVYHHENQFSYPKRMESKFDFHYLLDSMINLNLADLNVFNSQWNLNSCMQGYRQNRRRVPSQYRKFLKLDWCQNAKVVYPGVNLEYRTEGPVTQAEKNSVTILWNHRWEYDKRPDVFLRLLRDLKLKNVDFSLVLLGEMPETSCPTLQELKKEFSTSILHSGFVKDRHEYFEWLMKCDIAISTADHEFFGLSMLEARVYGCALIIPNKLSYPELHADFTSAYFYDSYEELLSLTLDTVGKTKTKWTLDLNEKWNEKNSFSELDRLISLQIEDAKGQ